MQKKAYRRANGGNSAPSLSEEARPRPLREHGVAERAERGAASSLRLPEEPTLGCRPRVKVIRAGTFLDVDDPSSPEGLGVTERSSRRSKTTSILQVRASGA
eukprot:s1200_g17.t1